MNIKCWLFGHKWDFRKYYINCTRCKATLARKTASVTFPITDKRELSEYTVVPLYTALVAEAACREAGYDKTAKELRRCLTAEK